MNPKMAIRLDEIFGRQLVEPHTQTPLGSSGVKILHEEAGPVWITYNRPSVEVLRQQAAIPVFTSEPC